MPLQSRIAFLRLVQAHLAKNNVPMASNVVRPVPVSKIAFVCQTHGNVFNFKYHPLHPSCSNKDCSYTYIGHLEACEEEKDIQKRFL